MLCEWLYINRDIEKYFTNVKFIIDYAVIVRLFSARFNLLRVFEKVFTYAFLLVIFLYSSQNKSIALS